jgi:hypothetical protein
MLPLRLTIASVGMSDAPNAEWGGCFISTQGKANVCCVQFSPHNSNLVAFGSADYKR